MHITENVLYLVNMHPCVRLQPNISGSQMTLVLAGKKRWLFTTRLKQQCSSKLVHPSFQQLQKKVASLKLIAKAPENKLTFPKGQLRLETVNFQGRLLLEIVFLCHHFSRGTNLLFDVGTFFNQQGSRVVVPESSSKKMGSAPAGQEKKQAHKFYHFMIN